MILFLMELEQVQQHCNHIDQDINLFNRNKDNKVLSDINHHSTKDVKTISVLKLFLIYRKLKKKVYKQLRY